jgi:hypothetical protein
MLGDHPGDNDNPADDSLVAGLSPYYGHDDNFGAAAINGYDYAYSTLGWFPDTLYNYLASLDGTYEVFDDSLNGTEMRTIHRFWEGAFAPGQSLTLVKIKAVSLEGLTGLIDYIDKGQTFIEYTPTILPFEFSYYGEEKSFLCAKGRRRQADLHFESESDACCNSALYEEVSGDWIRRKTWNYNDGITRHYDVPGGSTGIFKLVNNNSDFTMGLAFDGVSKFTDSSNLEDYAGFSMGWDDESSDEFGTGLSGAITIPNGDGDDLNMSTVPNEIGGAVTSLTVGFTTHDSTNTHWDNMEVVFDVMTATATEITVACAEADSPLVVISIDGPGEYSAELGAITHPGSSQLIITANGAVSFDFWGLRPFVACQGICGDANSDETVNISDAVYIINYVFVGGGPPVPRACGDANSDGTVNISDAVYIINYVFVGGGPPEDCSPGSANWIDGDCCPLPAARTGLTATAVHTLNPKLDIGLYDEGGAWLHPFFCIKISYRPTRETAAKNVEFQRFLTKSEATSPFDKLRTPRDDGLLPHSAFPADVGRLSQKLDFQWCTASSCRRRSRMCEPAVSTIHYISAS